MLLGIGLVASQVSDFSLGWGAGPEQQQHAISDEPGLLPFVAAPAVRFEEAEGPPAPPRTTGVRLPARSAATGRPVRLIVPKLGVDAPVVPISAPGRVLVPPNDPQTLGWWSGGAKPGASRGRALITGHTVHTGGGAFDDLETLQYGDRIGVRTVRGRVDYKVSGVRIYRKASLAQDARRVFDQSGPGRLVLVTCEDWNGVVYLSNAVIVADRASEP